MVAPAPPRPPLVDFLVARAGAPPPRGLAYDYVLAGDGLWLAAANAALAVRAPVARCAVRGLPALGGACRLRHGPVPTWIWCAGVAIATAMAAAGVEVALLVAVDGAGRYALTIPEQDATPTRVRYTAPDLPPDATIVLALHSHHRLPAYFSGTDDRDEQGLGLYGVLGRLGTPRPEVALRAGAYGHWLPVRWEAVFAGGKGPFRDVPFDPPDAAGSAGDPTSEPHGEEVTAP
ncbi:MAG TPA: Mov34/MPN/PAD-1 family protein [Thermomicrobiales bacterium]|nr:Mov34/MPN/PAD-1 family protein [Thermomicrobiales bacterium]